MLLQWGWGACQDMGGFDRASHDVSYPPLTFADVPSCASPVPIFPSVLRAAFVLLPAVDRTAHSHGL
jgi:hypothetical protein